ncbi:hypothetical protein CCACVL1_30077 [Corchorus capsularis]|uniref:Uncharacterized protein n=1 Tax=Corchorus capsularis TaxID=210143 RepID=A0A1R3FYT1_COCAP|nr:hypothetical protein CCACVL1_30077 [Corchorus capsularis]
MASKCERGKESALASISNGEERSASIYGQQQSKR